MFLGLTLRRPNDTDPYSLQGVDLQGPKMAGLREAKRRNPKYNDGHWDVFPRLTAIRTATTASNPANQASPCVVDRPPLLPMSPEPNIMGATTDLPSLESK